MKLRYLLFSLFLINVLQLSASQENNEASLLLKASSEACKSLENISYKSLFYQEGIKVEAQVIQEYAPVPNVGFGTTKVLVKGEFETPNQVQPFSFSYDGQFFKFHEEGKGEVQTVENPDARAIGRTLGFPYFLLVNNAFASEQGMDQLINSMDRAELIGKSEIEGKSCQQVRVYRTLKNPATQEEISSYSDWFIDDETRLPIGFESKSIRKTVIIESLKVKSQVKFDINAAGSKDEKKVLGNEAKTDGLPKVGSRFPQFSLNDVDGEVKSLDSFDSEVFIIDFWGTWCGPCLIAMPDLQALHQKYKDRKVQVIGISVHDAPGKAEKFVASNSYTYEFLVQGEELAKTLKLDTYPSIFVVDKTGKILHAEKGRRENAPKEIEAIIEKALKQK